MKEKIVFLVNPFSGTGNKKSIPGQIKALLDHTKYDHEIIFTEYAGHGAFLAEKKIKEGFSIIVAVGGDGTVNEIAGALKNTNAALGIIPGGSGNGFCMHLGIGRNPKRAIEILNTGKKIKIDTCMLNEHFYLNVAGLGFDAQIAYLTKNNKKRGFLHYFLTSMRESKEFKAKKVKLHLDNNIIIEGKYVAVVVANASMYGYNFTVAPSAALDDGLLDIMLIKDAPIYRLFISAYRFLNRSLHKSSLTETFRTRKIVMKCEQPVYYHIDGEGFEMAQSFEAKVIPNSLNVIAPRGYGVT
jgi:YegS/Rv2252/BmrU family lipid kinase